MAQTPLPSTPVWVRVWFRAHNTEWLVTYGTYRLTKEGEVKVKVVRFFVPTSTLCDASTGLWPSATGVIECYGVLKRKGASIEIRPADSSADD